MGCAFWFTACMPLEGATWAAAILCDATRRWKEEHRMEFQDAEKDLRTTNQIFSYPTIFHGIFGGTFFQRECMLMILLCLCFAYYLDFANYDLFHWRKWKAPKERRKKIEHAYTSSHGWVEVHRWFVIGKLFFMKSQSRNPFTHTNTLTVIYVDTDIHNQVNRINRVKEGKKIRFHKRSAMADKLKGK